MSGLPTILRVSCREPTPTLLHLDVLDRVQHQILRQALVVLGIGLETDHCLGLRSEEQSQQTVEGANVVDGHTAEIETTPKLMFGRHNAGREQRRNPTETTLPLHAFQQTVANCVGCGIEQMHRYQAVLQRLMAKRKVFRQIGSSHSPSIHHRVSHRASQAPRRKSKPDQSLG
jgi:hypothetical protein